MAKAKGKGKKKQINRSSGKQKKALKKKVSGKIRTKGASKKKAAAKGKKIVPRHKVSGVETSPIVTTTETIVAEEVTMPAPEITGESTSTGFVEPATTSEGEAGFNG